MLTRSELLQYKTWPNAYQIEKDYLQYVVLLEIFKLAGTELVFKGGTALQKCYGLDRFSEDLDFTATSEDAVVKLEEGLKRLKYLYNSTFTREETAVSTSFNLKIEGPLFQKPQSMQTIILEISKREQVLRKPTLIRVVPLYRDLEAQLLVVMDMGEMLAEKTKALFTRRRPRDLYDIYFLFKKGADADFELVNKKLELYKIRFDQATLSDRIAALEGSWDKELSILMKQIPDFREISDFVLNSFKTAARGK